MSVTYLVHRKQGHSYLFRSIPKDLQPQLGRRQFQLSFSSGILSRSKSLSLHLYSYTQRLYQKMRENQFQFSVDQVKDHLRVELAKIMKSNFSFVTKEKDGPLNIFLSQLSRRFLAPTIEVGYPEKTVNGYQDSHKLLLEVIGDIDIASITHQDGRRFVEVLKKSPVNRSKSFPTLTVNQLIELENVQLLSPKTISKHMERVSALFNWAIKQGYFHQNVFRGKLEIDRRVKTVERYFTTAELDLILCYSLKTESIESNKPERYWITLLSVYSGARLNEVCQLNVSDISKTDRIWTMNINDDSEDKSIKTKSGNRVIPLHPKLLNLGFLNYFNQIKNQNQEKLFPQLKK